MTETTRIKIKKGRAYVLRMPSSEAMMSINKHGELQELRLMPVGDEWHAVSVQFRYPDGEWYFCGYTCSEVGIKTDYATGEHFAYLPGFRHNPAEIKEHTAKCMQDLNAIFVNAGGVTIKL